MIGGVLAAQEWVEVQPNEFTFSPRLSLGINSQCTQKLGAEHGRPALQSHIKSPQMLLLSEGNIPVVKLLREPLTGRTLRRLGRSLRRIKSREEKA